MLDVFHHAVHGDGRPLGPLLDDVAATWGPADGLPMVDYTSQAPGRRRGSHAATIDDADFGRFHAASAGRDLNLMLEIEDREANALRAVALAVGDPHLRTAP